MFFFLKEISKEQLKNEIKINEKLKKKHTFIALIH